MSRVRGLDSDCKVERRKFWKNGEDFYFDCGSGYTGIDICQDSSKYTVKMGTLYVCMFYLNKVGFKQNKGHIGCCVEKTLPGWDRRST